MPDVRTMTRPRDLRRAYGRMTDRIGFLLDRCDELVDLYGSLLTPSEREALRRAELVLASVSENVAARAVTGASPGDVLPGEGSANR